MKPCWAYFWLQVIQLDLVIKLKHRFPESQFRLLPVLKVLQGPQINTGDYQASNSDFQVVNLKQNKEQF